MKKKFNYLKIVFEEFLLCLKLYKILNLFTKKFIFCSKFEKLQKI